MKSLIQPGLCSVTFRRECPERIIRLCSANGLAAIEWAGDVHVPCGALQQAQSVGEQTRSAGLAIAGYGSYFLAFDKEAEPSGSFEAVVETAQALGAPVIRIWAGSLSVSKTPEYFEKVVTACRQSAALAESAGIVVALEFHRNTFAETAAQSLKFLEAVNHPNLTMYWQPRHGSNLEERLQEISLLEKHLTSVHVFHWEYSPAPPYRRLALETGEAMWKPCLDRLRSLCKPLHALIEFVPHDDVEILSQEARTLRSWLAPSG